MSRRIISIGLSLVVAIALIGGLLWNVIHQPAEALSVSNFELTSSLCMNTAYPAPGQGVRTEKIDDPVSHNQVDQRVVIADGSSRPERILAEHAYDPEFSPDRRVVAFTRRNGIFKVNADGSGEQQLTRSRTVPYAFDTVLDSVPTWSPDGSFIIFVRTVELNQARLMVMRNDGTNEQVIIPDGVQFHTIYSKARWSPDGKQIALVAKESVQATNKLFVLSFSEFPTKSQSRIGPTPENVVFIYNWLPDGSKLSFTVNPQEQGGKQNGRYVIEPATGKSVFVETRCKALGF